MRFCSRQFMSTPLLPPNPGSPLSARSIRCGERSAFLSSALAVGSVGALLGHTQAPQARARPGHFRASHLKTGRAGLLVGSCPRTGSRLVSSGTPSAPCQFKFRNRATSGRLRPHNLESLAPGHPKAERQPLADDSSKSGRQSAPGGVMPVFLDAPAKPECRSSNQNWLRHRGHLINGGASKRRSSRVDADYLRVLETATVGRYQGGLPSWG